MEDALERVLPRIGGSETLDRLAALSGSDFTSVMLEVARRRAAGETPASVLRRYERDRFVRPGAAGFFAHFGLFALVTAGRDTGSGEFERSALAGQLRIAIRGVTEATAAEVRIALTPLSGRGERVALAVTSDLGPDGGAEIVIDRERQAGRGYYRDLCFKVHAGTGGQPHEVGDGGLTDWTARLTANAKERLLICGVSTDRLAALPAASTGG